MYNTALFAEDRAEVLAAHIRAHPLGILITTDGDGTTEASHIPMFYEELPEGPGTLRCHLARANSQWRTIEESPMVLVVFPGPEHYISPSWYPSKSEHGKVVPTWNYVAVHARGRASTFEAPDKLLAHLKELTAHNESAVGGSWAVKDAPEDFIAANMRAIVGVEIAITVIEGKWKVSQNRTAADQAGAIEGLQTLGSSASGEMAGLIAAAREHR